MKGRNLQIQFQEQPPPLPELAPEMGTRVVTALWALLLVGITLLTYIPSLNGSFIFGDDVNVRENGAVKSWRGLWWIWRYAFDMPQFSPLAYTSFLLEYNTVGW